MRIKKNYLLNQAVVVALILIMYAISGCSNITPYKEVVNKTHESTKEVSTATLVRPAKLAGFYVSKRITHSTNFVYLDSAGYGNAEINKDGKEIEFPALNIPQFGWETNLDTTKIIIRYKDINQNNQEIRFRLRQMGGKYQIVLRESFGSIIFTKVEKEELRPSKSKN